MIQIRDENFVRKLKWNLRKNWKQYLTKGLTYVLVALVAAAIVFVVMDSRAVRLAQIEEAIAKLNAANAKAEALLGQVGTINQDTQTMLDDVTKKEEEVSKKIDELEENYNEIQNKENLRWVLPMRYLNLSSSYGYRTHPVTGEKSFHTGVDLAGPKGTPIVASRSGTVTKAEYQDAAGNFVAIDHYDGYESYYMHMTKSIVEVGQVVIAGQVIGYCGETGTATGPHLHFEVYRDGKRVNPSKLLDLY